jgi:intein/homing endonuclease
MTRGPVAILRTTPRTVLEDYHRLMSLAGYRDVIAPDADTALKVNISWHFFFPGSSTTPWQLEGVIRAMRQDGYRPERLHACHNRTVVIDAHLGERENKHLPVVEAHGLRNVHLYEGEEWVHIRDAVGDLADRFLCLNQVYPDGFHIPKRFLGENIVHLPTVKCVHPDTQVVLADGSLVRIAELVEGELAHGVAVLDADGDVRVKAEICLVGLDPGGAPGIRRTCWLWRTPVRGHEIVRVRLKTGREVTVSPEHPFLTPRGWGAAKSLRPGDRVAIPRRLEIPGASQPLPRLHKQYGRTSTRWIDVPAETSPEFWRWMGYFLAEGWVQPMRTTCRFGWSNSDPALVRDFTRLTAQLFGLELTSRSDQPGNHYLDSLQLREFFEALDLPVPLSAGNKRVPHLLFRCPAEEIAAFLEGYFDGDGGVGPRDGLHAVTRSERLADALQHLLNRLGVIAFKRNRRGRPTPDEPYRDYFGVSVHGDELVELSRHVRLRSAHKQHRLDALVARRQAGKRPSTVFRSVRLGLGLTQASSGRADTALAFVEPIAEMEFLAPDGIAWDHVRSIERVTADTPYLYDLTMDEAPTFVGNGIVLHNTHVFTTTTGAMKNAFGGLLNERRHWTHPVIHETLVDLLRIQQRIHRGVFAVMDGTFAGDGPGPRCMVPHVKNVLLASADQVAIDAVAARLMGFDPLAIRYIRLAHEAGLGCGDPRAIRLVGDVDAAREPWGFVGPFRRMTFASRMQHRIYWGPLKAPVEWSLKTVLAPWAYVASVLYHDSFWYPLVARRQMAAVLGSDWGRLFQNWERLAPDARGYPDVGEAPAELSRTGLRAFATSLGVLATCLREAPELAARRRRGAVRQKPSA